MKRLMIFLVFMMLLTGCKKKNDENLKALNTYEASEVCRLHNAEEVDGDIYNSESIVYLNYDENTLVNSAIYQSISELSSINSYTYEVYDYIKDIYSNIKGVNVDYYKTSNGLVLEIKYDYTVIELDEFRDTLGGLLDLESVLGSVDKIPVKLETFKEMELKDYECKLGE